MRGSTLVCLAALGVFGALAVSMATEESAVVQLSPEEGGASLGETQEPTKEAEQQSNSIEEEATAKADGGDKEAAAEEKQADEAAEEPAKATVPTKQSNGEAAMQAKVAKNLAAVQNARSAVEKANQNLSRNSLVKAHNAAHAAAAATNGTETPAKDAETASPEPKDEAAAKKAEAEREKTEEATKVAQETAKLVKEKMKAAVEEADKEAKKDAEESAKAIVDEAKSKGESTSEKSIVEAREALKKARDEHAAAVKTLAAAKEKAGISAVQYKATAKALEGIKHQEEVAKIPVADDDLKARTKLSAVDWAKKAAEERLIAYRDHMDAAHAADKEAAASQALLDAEHQVSQLEREVEVARLKVNELKGIVKEARFDAEEVKARAKFTTRGEMAKLKYKEIDEQNAETVSKEEQDLNSARKKLMLSERALGELKTGGTLEMTQKAEKDALAELASADAQARIATQKVMFTKEKAAKAAALVEANNEKRKAEKAVKAKKLADKLMAAKKEEQKKGNAVKNAATTLEKAKAAAEKSEKSAVQAKIASEKAKKAAENKSKMEKMKANEGDAKGIEKKKKANESAAKKTERDEQAKEKTAKESQKAEIDAKTMAVEKTAKDNAKEKDQKATKLAAGEEGQVKAAAAKAAADDKEGAEKTKEAQQKHKAEQDFLAKSEEAKEKLRAASAKGTPCDTCMAKCSTDVCRTWCNANWCEGMKDHGGRKELYEKLKEAKEEQQKAAAAMKSSKAQLDKDIQIEKAASGHAKAALTKAAETGEEKDVMEARDDTKAVETDERKVAEAKKVYKKEDAAWKHDGHTVDSLEQKAEPPHHLSDTTDT